ncbi:Aspartic peptidase domain [Pseudocohnilembus persalinus]|uniref:Aspartic peptidase domain n=1 Tax=Pseudocohnilembus persalinus TaxID=266149 RepID=A0A0V0QYI2_PSEPJ|nr:Aspartic peptidase domain [Pseudocohnilembus persalinus]|eukprot:KRX07367.1 Aspartic peptidase domain [Pseudocohnilembus persalinus]
MAIDIEFPFSWIKSRECKQCQQSEFNLNSIQNGQQVQNQDICYQGAIDNCSGEKVIITQGQKQSGGPFFISYDNQKAIKGQFVGEHMSFLGYDPDLKQSFLQIVEDELDSEQRLKNHEEIIQLKDFNMLAVDQMLGYNYYSADGVIGLGPIDQNQQIRNSNFLDALKVSQNDEIMNSSIFGVFINNKGKNIKEHIITFGGININLAFQKSLSSIKWVKVPQNQHHYWNLDVKYLKIEFSAFDFKQTHDNFLSNTISLNQIPAVLTINSSFISLPFQYIQELVKVINAYDNTNCVIVDNEVNLIYCKQFSVQHELTWNFELGVKGTEDNQIHQVKINAQNLIRDCNTDQTNSHVSDRFGCTLNINVSKDDKIILGEPFMKQHYMIFDQDEKKIGILKANDDQNWGINGDGMSLHFDSLFKIMAYFLLCSFLSALILAICVVPIKYGVRNIKQFVFTMKHNASRQEVRSLTQSHNDEDSPYAEVEAAMREQAMKEIEQMEKNLNNEDNDNENKFYMNNGQDNSFQDTTLDAFDLDFSRNKKKQEYDGLDQESGF